MRLAGLDTMRFTTELLPLLTDQPGVIIEVTGQPADYREAGDSLRIAVSTDEVAGSTDWFDLGVTLSVGGTRGAVPRRVPGTQPRRAAHAASRRRVLLAAEARAAGTGQAHRGGAGAAGLAAGSAQDQPVSGRAVGRTGRARGRRPPGRTRGRSRSAGCCHPTASAVRTRQRRCGHGCGPTSRTVSAGWRSCGSTGSAASSPTTWASARPCRPWR